MRYLIVGAGAVGTALAAALADAGRDVVVVLRDGLPARTRMFALRTPDREVRVPITVAGSADQVELEPTDVLVLTVKTQDVAAALAPWAGRRVGDAGSASALIPVVCAQNGLESERVASRLFERVYGAVLLLSARARAPFDTVAYGTPVAGIVDVGAYPPGAPFALGEFTADLTAAGFASRAVADILGWKRAKLRLNVANAVDAFVADAEREKVRAAVRAEADAAFAAVGAHVVAESALLARMGASEVVAVPGAPPMRNSTQQSLDRGTSVETDYLNGEIALLAASAGLACPHNRRLQQLAREHGST